MISVPRYERAITEHERRVWVPEIRAAPLINVLGTSRSSDLGKRLPLSMNFQSTAMFSRGWHSAIARHYVGKAKFLPYRAWRNDSKDSQLLNQARRMLGLSSIGSHGWPRLARMLNVTRYRMGGHGLDDGLTRIEDMFGRPLSN